MSPAIKVYERGLRTGVVRLVRDDGYSAPVPIDGWAGAVSPADARLLDRCTGPTLDVGCGPGRMTAALLSRGLIALGIAFAICFVTGLISHLIQQPPGWLDWPNRPIWLYRVNQGVHVSAGVASIPLLGIKLWVVSPKFWRVTVRCLERGTDVGPAVVADHWPAHRGTGDLAGEWSVRQQ